MDSIKKTIIFITCLFISTTVFAQARGGSPRYWSASGDDIYYAKTGNVGIGTSTPIYSLDVIGTVGATSFSGDGTNIRNVSSAAWTASGDDVYYAGAGNVGIGDDDPEYKLNVIGTIGATAFSGDGSDIRNISSAVWTISGDDAYYGQSGNLGIGIDDPTYSLDIAGAVQALSFSGDGSNITGVSAGASTALDNLVSVSINDTLVSDTDSTDDLGSSLIYWANTYTDQLYTTGNVGIGTTAPGEKLQIGNGLGTNNVLIKHTDGQESALMFRDNQGTPTGFDIVDDAANNVLRFDSTSISNILVLERITGNVGIGTTGPGEKLEVVKDGGASYIKTVSYRDEVGSGGFTIRHARGSVASPGNLQNGDTLGTMYFSGYHTADFWDAGSISAVVDGTPGNGDMPGKLLFKTTPDGSTTLQTRMVIDNTGNVGIGTTTPSSLLHLYKSSISSRTSFMKLGSDAASRNFWNFGGNANEGLYIYPDTDGDSTSVVFEKNDSTDWLQMKSDGDVTIPNGNVGIGTTTPNTILDIYGGITNRVTTVNSATYNVLATDNIIHHTYSSTGVSTTTLPTAQTLRGRTIIWKDASGNASVYNINIDTQGSETIDGDNTRILNSDYESVKLYSDGSNWFEIN